MLPEADHNQRIMKQLSSCIEFSSNHDVIVVYGGLVCRHVWALTCGYFDIEGVDLFEYVYLVVFGLV